jgi:DUF4097 and DUF4098 domain-containing protein YvlB
MEQLRIDLPVAVTLRVQSRSGKVLVIAEPRDDIEAETDEVESFMADGGATLVVRSSRGGAKPLTVRCPVDTDVVVGTQSGSVQLQGKFGNVHVTSASGSIDVDEADDVDLRSMSGSLQLRQCHGRCRLSAISGKIDVGSADAAHVASVSGSIRVGSALGDVKARSVSGNVELGASGAGRIAVQTVSGGVRIALPKGTEPETRFKTRGRVRCDFERGYDCRVECASLSGSIEVVPA